MNLCSTGHEEVCYDSRECPACEVIVEMQKEIDELKRSIGMSVKYD
jgi:hypothetical protein